MAAAACTLPLPLWEKHLFSFSKVSHALETFFFLTVLMYWSTVCSKQWTVVYQQQPHEVLQKASPAAHDLMISCCPIVSLVATLGADYIPPY